MSLSLDEAQNEIIEEFQILGDDRESTIVYLMELGEKMPIMPDSDKIEDNTIKGCQSKVWLTSALAEDKIRFRADSNTAITKGLISLLIRIFDNRSPNEILDSELTFIDRIGMQSMIGSQRSNGFAAMIKQIKMIAIAYQAQLSNANTNN